MSSLNTPRMRLFAASTLLAALLAASAAHGASAAGVARVVLGLCALVALAWWWSRRSRPGFAAVSQQRMIIHQRVGLSPRCGLALVAVDGTEMLISFGEGFADVHPLNAPALRRSGRRPVRKARVSRRRLPIGGRS